MYRRELAIVTFLVLGNNLWGQSAVPGRAVPQSDPPEITDSGDSPLDDICASGSPPDVIPKLSIPASPAMLQAAHTRALSAKTTAGDGIGVAIGPDGNMHIVLDPSVRIASGYRYLYNWSALAPRAIPKGPTVQPPLTEFELALNELAWKRNDRGRRATLFTYHFGEFVQTIAAGVKTLRPPPTAVVTVAPASSSGTGWVPRNRPSSPAQTIAPLSKKEQRFVQDTASALSKRKDRSAPLPRGFGNIRILKELDRMKAHWQGVYRQSDGTRMLMQGPTQDTTRLILLKSNPSGPYGITPFGPGQIFEIHVLGKNRVRMFVNDYLKGVYILTVDIRHGPYHETAVQYLSYMIDIDPSGNVP